jgi:hypothetical protein
VTGMRQVPTARVVRDATSPTWSRWMQQFFIEVGKVGVEARAAIRPWVEPALVVIAVVSLVADGPTTLTGAAGTVAVLAKVAERVNGSSSPRWGPDGGRDRETQR